VTIQFLPGEALRPLIKMKDGGYRMDRGKKRVGRADIGTEQNVQEKENEGGSLLTHPDPTASRVSLLRGHSLSSLCCG